MLDSREWQIPEQMVIEGMEARTDERNFLGCHAILLQSKKHQTQISQI
jgi:hypothetical protein